MDEGIQKMADKTYYLITTRSKNTDERSSKKVQESHALTRSLSSLHARHGDYFDSEEQFVESVLKHNALLTKGITVREATEDDIVEHGAAIEIFEALDDFEEADRVAAASKKAARQAVLRYIDRHVKSADDIEALIKQHPKLSGLRVRQWANIEREDFELGDIAVESWADYEQGKKKNGPKKAALVRDFYSIKGDPEA